MSTDVHDPSAILEHARGLRALAIRLVGPERAEDLVQDTYLKALENPPSRERPLGPWLVRVLVNGSYSLLRRGRSTASPDVVEGEACSVPTPERIAEELDAAERLLEAVGRLAHPASTIVSMRYFREMDSGQIGEALGMPAPTVRWHLQRALTQLRTDLEVRSRTRPGGWVAGLAPLLSPLGRADLANALGTRMRSAGTGSSSALSGLLPFVAVVLVLGGVLFAARGPSMESEPAVAAVDDDRPDVVPMIKLLPATPIGSARCRPAAPMMMTPAKKIARPVTFGHDQVMGEVPATARVGVRVVDLEGRPVQGAELRTPDAGAFALADSDGRCSLELSGVIDGSAECLLEQLSALRVVAPGHASRTLAPVLEVGDVDLGEVVVTPELELAGTVVSFDGEPIEGVEVSAWCEDSRPEALMAHVACVHEGDPDVRPLARASSGSGGAFRLQGVSGDAVLLAITSPAREVLSVHEVKLPVDGPLELVADSPSRPESLEVEVRAPGGAPVGGAIVKVHGAFRPEELWTDDRGRLSVQVAEGGDRYISAWDAEGLYAPTTVERGREGRVVLELGEGAVHRVRVVDAEGAPVESFDWQLRFHGMTRAGSSIDGMARVALPANAVSCRWRHAALDVLIDGRVAGSARLRVGEPGSEWTVRLVAPKHLEGEVLHDGAPVAGALVMLRLLGDGPCPAASEEGVRVVRTGPSGSFRFQVDRRTVHELRVVADGLAPCARVVLPRDGDDQLERVELTRGGTLLGRVHPSLYMIAPIMFGPLKVLAEGLNGEAHEAPMDIDGSFRMEGLEAGPWRLRMAGHAGGESLELAVEPGRTTRVELGAP